MSKCEQAPAIELLSSRSSQLQGSYSMCEKGPTCRTIRTASVPKDGARDRMVLDGRPANMADEAQHSWSQAMASSSSLTATWFAAGKT